MFSVAARLRFALTVLFLMMIGLAYVVYEAWWLWFFSIPVISMNLLFMPVWFHTMLTLAYMFVTLFCLLLALTNYIAGAYLADKLEAFKDPQQAWVIIILMCAIMVSANLTHFLKTISR